MNKKEVTKMTKKEIIAEYFKKLKTRKNVLSMSDEKIAEITKLSGSKSAKSIKWYISKIRTGKMTIGLNLTPAEKKRQKEKKSA
jgi:hypothetical protein